LQAWQREEAALAEQLAAMGDAIERLEPTDMDRAEQLGQQLTTLEAKEWAQLQQLAQRLLQIPNVEGTEQLRQKVGIEVELS
jgi:seryl-tRNA synthetase